VRTTGRRATARWIVLGLVAVVAVAVVATWLTAPRSGGRMDPGATSTSGAHALATLLRERGVEVVVARTVEDVERHAGPDALLLIAQTFYLRDDDLLDRLAAAPGDRLVFEPNARAREALSPGVMLARGGRVSPDPECDLPAARRAGEVAFEDADLYQAAGETGLTRCYGGALVRYQTGGRTVTVAGGAGFMTNAELGRQGSAALAMNLAGEKPRLVWFAPQRMQGQGAGGATVGDLIPDAAVWVVLQLGLVVLLAALWRGRRLGPLVAERLPVVVRASETVEGRGRLYRSVRARSQAAAALRTATLGRISARLGLGGRPGPAAVTAAVAQRCSAAENTVRDILFGPPPATDSDLRDLAQSLDDLERQVRHS